MLRPNPKDEPIALPKFMGYKDRQLPREFLERYKEYCDVCSTATESHLRLFPVSLDTPPKQWWHFVGGFSEWNPFTADFEAEFTRVDYKAKLREHSVLPKTSNVLSFMQSPSTTTASATATHHPYKYWLLLVEKNPCWKF